MSLKVLEVAVRECPNDAFAGSVKHRVKTDLGIDVDDVRSKEVYIFDTKLSDEELEKAQKRVFEDPQTQISSFERLEMPYDYMIEVAWKPGVTDTKGRVSGEALEDLLGPLDEDEKIYTSRQILLRGKDLTQEQVMQIAKLYANEAVQDKRLFSKQDKFDIFVPNVDLGRIPKVDYINLEVSDEELLGVSTKRKLALNLDEMKSIQAYFRRDDIKKARAEVGMQAMPTDVELEALAQTWSEHCKHKIFNAKIIDETGSILDGIDDIDWAISEIEKAGGEVRRAADGKITYVMIDSIFNTFIKNPTMKLKENMPWIKSVLKDNAGVMVFDEKWLYTLKWESHNSPSAEEPYGGAYTGIVGVFRDPMGTGRGGKIVAGFWSFHTGSPNYDGNLVPKLHPRQIREGVRQGVEAGGNRSGNPTLLGFVYSDEGFIGKPYIGVGACSVIPREIDGEPGEEKIVNVGDLAIVIGGRVGIDGIHGATESSMEGGKHISAGHVQIGDAYMQKKVQEFVIEARDKLLFKGVQDFGAGGISSAFGELGEFTNGIFMDIGRHPAKYAGLMPWQVFVSESQERMGLVVTPENLEELKKLAKKHDIELTVLGGFNNAGKIHVMYNDINCVYLDMDFLHDGGPQFVINAKWLKPEERGLAEPSLSDIVNHGETLKKILARENVASFNYIVRQFDHEVQGGSVIKPLVGVKEDVHSDASVTRPILDSNKGLIFAAGENPQYGKIDTYHMTLGNIDEAIRRVIAVGGNLEQLPMNDNFGWPSPLPKKNNPDAEYKAAQLARAAIALAHGMYNYNAACVSGKDSDSMDGTIQTKDGKEVRVSIPPIVQMSTAALIDDVRKCISMDAKAAGDLVYVIGLTKDELGGSEYYAMQNAIGRNVPVTDIKSSVEIYDTHSKAVDSLLVESSRGVYRGGLGVHLAEVAFAGDLGIEVDLNKVQTSGLNRDDKILYSESTGRLIVTIAPDNKGKFEELMKGKTYAHVGYVTEDKRLKVKGLNGNLIMDEPIDVLRKAYHSTFDGDLNETV